MNFDLKFLPYLLTFTSTMIVFLYQVLRELKGNKTDIVEMRLKNVYSPLYNSLLIDMSSKVTENTTISKILKEYSYLLEEQLLEMLEVIIKMEHSSELSKNIAIKDEEYQFIRNEIMAIIRKEYYQLKSINDKNSFRIIQFEKMSFMTKVINTLLIVSRNISIVFIILFGMSWVYTEYLSAVTDMKLLLGSVLAYITMVSITITFSIYPSRIADSFEKRIKKKNWRKRKNFQGMERANETTTYVCTWCGSERKLYEYERFGKCTKCKWNHMLKGLFTNWFRWKKVPE